MSLIRGHLDRVEEVAGDLLHGGDVLGLVLKDPLLGPVLGRLKEGLATKANLA